MDGCCSANLQHWLSKSRNVRSALRCVCHAVGPVEHVGSGALAAMPVEHVGGRALAVVLVENVGGRALAVVPVVAVVPVDVGGGALAVVPVELPWPQCLSWP